MLKAQRLLVLTVWACLFSNFIFLMSDALPATTSVPHTTHIISYVHQGRANGKSVEISEFDFESISSSSSGAAGSGYVTRSAALRATEPPTPLSQFYGAFVEQLDKSLDNSFSPSSNNTTPIIVQTTNEAAKRTDDLLVVHQNTLNDTDVDFEHSEQHESSSATAKNLSPTQSGDDIMLKRMKLSIPVLEPVRHLLNTVRDQHNQTVHAARQHHRLLAGMTGSMADHMPTNESSAIETEEDRETANESTEFKLLDFAGSLVGMLWGFIGNLQRAFAASSGNAFASSSSGSLGGE